MPDVFVEAVRAGVQGGGDLKARTRTDFPARRGSRRTRASHHRRWPTRASSTPACGSTPTCGTRVSWRARRESGSRAYRAASSCACTRAWSTSSSAMTRLRWAARRRAPGSAPRRMGPGTRWKASGRRLSWPARSPPSWTRHATPSRRGGGPRPRVPGNGGAMPGSPTTCSRPPGSGGCTAASRPAGSGMRLGDGERGAGRRVG